MQGVGIPVSADGYGEKVNPQALSSFYTGSDLANVHTLQRFKKKG